MNDRSVGQISSGQADRCSTLPTRLPVTDQSAWRTLLGAAMAIGPRFRAWLGPLEVPAANLYRACFVDLGHLARQVREWTPAASILEIGCGEGALTERLSLVYPKARITGIDITPKVGRLFCGDRERVHLRSGDDPCSGRRESCLVRPDPDLRRDASRPLGTP